LSGVVSGGVARGLAQPPATGRHPDGMLRVFGGGRNWLCRWGGLGFGVFGAGQWREAGQSWGGKPTFMATQRVLIIGAGVIGLTHAVTAREAGYEVTVLERDGRALGASVRNFGTLWPIGCALGPERDQAQQP
jgi:NADPH-dependent 2,4-dienoyl-CoA reductase/sulfur reductase-like enzyme